MDEARKEQLRQLLNENHKWPGVYMFKFLMENDPNKISRLKGVFDESAEVKVRFSQKGNYAGITVRELILDVDSIFERYQAVSDLGGITAL